MAHTSIRPKARALTNSGLAVALVVSIAAPSAFAKSKEYENFDLPKNARSAPEAPTSAPGAIGFSNSRIKVTPHGTSYKTPGVNAQDYLFAKEAFVTEKRDEAIKLLRQEIDSGYTRNRDNLQLRLGQLYAEKYMELSYRENELYTAGLAEYDKAKVTNKNAKPPKMDQERSQRYLKDALVVFQGLKKEYPRHPKIDEIIFFIGFVDMETGNTKEGMQYLERVVREFPRSRKYEEAVVYLGDQYFDAAKFRDALAKYRILLNRKESALYDYATYKIAWCELNTGAQARGLNDMKGLIAKLDGNKEASKFNLREQALRDLVIFYGEVGQVDEAIAYFSDHVGRDKAMENLKLIADILRSKARDQDATRAYEKLLDQFPDSPDAPRLALGMNESLSRLGNGEKAVSAMVANLGKYNPNSDWFKKIPENKVADAKAAMNDLAAEAAREGFFFHNSGQKSANKNSYRYALEIYQSLLTNFPNFPDRKKVAFYRGEILFAQAKWIDASEAYMIAAKTAPKDKLADEATYNALLSLDRLTAKHDNLERFSKEEQKKVDTTPQDIPNDEKRFIDVAQYYMTEYPQGSRVVDVRFRIASIYYRYHHFDESQAMFREIVTKYPRHRSATTAANIVLDIYNIKKDYVALNTNAQLFAKMDGLGDSQFKADMAHISNEIGFKSIEGLETQNKWAEAGETYFNFYKNNPNSPLAEKALYNAFVSFEKANNADKMAEASKLFVAKFPKSDYTKRFLLTLARTSEKNYDFEQAQKLYADYHTRFPTDKESRKALYNSAVFAELLEKNTQALALYDEYLKSKEVTADEKKSIAISQAKIYAKEHNWEKMNVIYRRLQRDAKAPEEKMEYLGQLAKQYEKGNKLAEREAILKEMRYFYDSRKGWKATGAVQFVAEAKFKALTAEREKYEKVALKFPPEDLLYLLKRKQKLLTKLAKDYDAVVEVGVPDWGVAALYEKSDAFENFGQAFHNLKVPTKYKGPDREELDKQLKVLDDKLVKPIQAKAEDFLKSCSAKAAQFYVANEYSVKCRDRLAQLEAATPLPTVADKSGKPTEKPAVAKTGTIPDPKGLFPQPSYWTTRWTGEVAKK